MCNDWCVVRMWSVVLLLVVVPVRLSLVNVTEEAQNYKSYPCTNQNHLVLVPGALPAGGTTRVCVSRFHVQGTASVMLYLRAEGQETTATRQLLPGDGGCLELPVPLLPNTKAELIISIRYHHQCTWEHRLWVRVTSGRVVVLHTERPRYRPGETVRARALVLKADLMPAHGHIEEIWLESPPGAWEGTRAAQWDRVRTRLGFGQIQHQLDDQAPAGKWTLRARLDDGSQGKAEFWVGNYEIPPFHLSVRHATRVLRTSERLVWTVCVRYPWTEAVEGMLVIRLRGAGVAFSAHLAPGVRTAVQLRAPKACHRHAVAARRIGLDSENPPDVVVADFSFQEEGTRIWQNTTVVSQVVEKAVTLEFLSKDRVVLAPGLPYKLKIKATRWDDKPPSNERIHVCRAPAYIHDTSSLLCDVALTDNKGVARVMFTIGNDDSDLYNFTATLQSDNSTAAAPLLLRVRRAGAAHGALGPLHLHGAQDAVGYVPLYLNNKDIDTALSVHFVVITRGGTIYRWGVTTQCPISGSKKQISNVPRNSLCPKYDPEAEDNNKEPVTSVLHDKRLLRVELPVKITHQMCPDSHLIVYFRYKGELVSAVKHIEMEECFVNKVEARWVFRQVAPGDTAALSLTTSGLALCALSVVDSAAHWLDPAPSAKDVIMERLRNLIDSHRNLTEYDAECMNDNTEITGSLWSFALTQSWLAAAGVRAVGGASGARIACSQASPPEPLRADASSPRTDFSEAWLWRLVAVGANGTVLASTRAPDSITRYEASALCVARNGLAVASPASLQVFREFFIHADGPKRLRSGDTSMIQYRIFNYLYEALNIKIQVLADPHLEVPDRTEVAAVAARSSVTRRIALLALVPGAARLAIRAKATKQGVSDEVIITIEVEPEGVPVQDYQSALLCGPGSAASSTTKVSWSWPAAVAVPGSESVTAWAVGGVAGPLLADADSLVLLPRGCGEQNMARLATNLLALNQLDPKSEAATAAKEHVSRGYTRQLQYAHASGGFSAFGGSDEPSTWLTAFAVRYLRKAHAVLFPDTEPPPSLRRAERWLIGQQMENGCFRTEGQIFHRELRGGFNEDGEIASVALTAYVITSLVEAVPDLPYKVLKNTFHCLRALPSWKFPKSPNRIYAHAILAYAFMKLRKYEEDLRRTNEASPWESERIEEDENVKELMELMGRAKRIEDFVWWETSSLGTTVEATGYALLALTACPPALRMHCERDARAALRWLSARRGAGGGFVATQDTLIALEALMTWWKSQPPAPTQLTVTAVSGGGSGSGSESAIVTLTPQIKVPEVMKMGLGELTVQVEGSGCALVQATRSYHTLSPPTSKQLLSVQVSVRTDGQFNCAANGTSCFCAAVVETCVVWTDEFPEMALLDVVLPGGYSADAALLYKQLVNSDPLLRRIELSPTAARATLYLAARGGVRLLGAHQCYAVHAVGPAARTMPAHVRVQHYYEPALNDTQVRLLPGAHHCYAVHAVGPAARTTPAHVRVQHYYEPALNDTQVRLLPGAHHCYAVHAVGPAARTTPAHVRVQHYYEPALNDTQVRLLPGAHHCYAVHAVGPAARTTPAHVRVQHYYEPALNDTQVRLLPGAHHCYAVHAVGPAARTTPAHVRVQHYYEPALNDTQVRLLPGAHHCYAVHAVGPAARITPAHVRVQHYYEPALNDTQVRLLPGAHQCYAVHAVGPAARITPAHLRVQHYYEPALNDTQVRLLPREHQCYAVHAVGPAARITPAHLRVQHYYEPALNDTQVRLLPREHQCYAVHAVGPAARITPAHLRVQHYYEPALNDTQVRLLPREHQCYAVHAVGPAARITPAHVRVQHYYEPALNDTQVRLLPGAHQCYAVHAVGPAARITPAHLRVQHYYEPALNDTQVRLLPREHQCYAVHAVGPAARTMPAHVRVQHYYEPALNDTQVRLLPGAHQCHAVHAVGPAARTMPAHVRVQHYYEPALKDTQVRLLPGAHQCHAVHAVGPAARTMPAHVRVQHYYEPALKDTQVRLLPGAHQCHAVHAVGPAARTMPAHVRVQHYYEPALKDTQVRLLPGAHQCHAVHAVGPAARTMPAHVRVQHYYEPALNNTQMYTIPEDCPPQIAQRSNDYSRSDNLFSKARSENGEILLITDEYSLDDVPDGIPQEYPVSENLTQADNDEPDKRHIELGPSKDEPKSENEIFDVERILEGNMYDGQGKKGIDISEDETVIGVANFRRKSDLAKVWDDQDIEVVSEQTTEIKGAEVETSTLSGTPMMAALKENDPQVDVKLQVVPAAKPEVAGVENPQLSSFHVVDSEKDLDVPEGLEGPVPVAVLPPPSFLPRVPLRATPLAASPFLGQPKACFGYSPEKQQTNQNQFINLRSFNFGKFGNGANKKRRIRG